MRYVFLLLILCLAFVALNSVSKYSRPLSFLSTGSAAPASGNAYSAHRHSNSAVSAGNSDLTGSAPSKGGPSEGFGLKTGSAGGDVKNLDNPNDAGAVGSVASAELTPASLPSPKTLVNRSTETTTINKSGNGVRQAATVSQTNSLTSTVVSLSKASSIDAQAASSHSASGAIANSAIVASTNAKNDETMPASLTSPTNEDNADVADATTAVTSDDATASAVMDLNSPLALDADFLELAPLPDAVQVQPSAAPFTLSAQSEAYALHIQDSIRNSLMDPHGIQFGGIAGLNWSGASATSTTGKVSGTPLMGFNLGFFADIPVEKKVSIRPELLYSFEGYQPDVNGQRINVHVAYLTMPIDLVYHTNWFNKRIYVGAGPYAAYGLSGTYTMKGIDTDMQFGNNYANGDNMKRVDLGANFMAGILLDRNFILGAKFDLGLSNIASGGSASQIHTRSFGLSVGYVFRNKANTKTL